MGMRSGILGGGGRASILNEHSDGVCLRAIRDMSKVDTPQITSEHGVVR